MHTDVDDELDHDIESLNATLEGREPPAVRRTSSAGTTSVMDASKPQLSKRTIKVLTKLEVATATPGESDAHERHEETEEEAAERELAEAEKKKRAAELAAGSGGGAPATGSTAAAGGHAGAHVGSGGSTSTAPASTTTRARKAAAEDKEYDILIKLLLLGDVGVGKTSLMLRYSEDKFSTSLLATAGVDYQTQHLEIEGKRVRCQIWDTAGQQRFHAITHAYYKAAHGIVLIYDASEKDSASFNNINYWMENINKHASAHTQKILIGNKVDIKPKVVRSRIHSRFLCLGACKRLRLLCCASVLTVYVCSSTCSCWHWVQVDFETAKAAADAYGTKFFETSAKDGVGVREAFYAIARDVVLKMLANDGVPDSAAVHGGKGSKDGKDKKDCVIM